MDTMLQHGDFARGGNGYPLTVTGKLELLQRAFLRLTVRRGAFALDRELGSDLYKLKTLKRSLWEERALIYAKEALSSMPEVTAKEVRVRSSQENKPILLDYQLKVGDDMESVVVTV